MSNTNKYWLNRDLQAREALYEATAKQTEVLLRKQYLRVEKNVLKEMQDVYNKILREAGTEKALVSDLYKFNRYYELLGSINKKLDSLRSSQKTILKNKFAKLYKKNTNLIEEQLGLSSYIDENKMKKVIYDVWCSDGKNWSDRLWTNKAKLVESLSSGLIDSIAAGKSYEALTKTLMGSFNQGYSESVRLARTELSHIYNQSAIDKYEDAGIKQVIYLTGRDERTCEVCGADDGEVFDISDAPYLPRHPNCRCTWLAKL